MTLLTLLRPNQHLIYVDGGGEIDFYGSGDGTAVRVVEPSGQVTFSGTGDGIYIVETEGTGLIAFSGTGVGIRVPTGDEIADYIIKALPPASAVLSVEQITLTLLNVTEHPTALVTAEAVVVGSSAVLAARESPVGSVIGVVPTTASVSVLIPLTVALGAEPGAQAVVAVRVAPSAAIVAH